jgi:glycosyltransferase involved in cell wall biosynthesis
MLPALNEAKNIGAVLRGVLKLSLPGTQIVALVVDDGSRDDTAAVARAAGAEVVSHPVNRGVGAAFRTGRSWALDHGADYFAHLDSDGQVDPADLAKVFAPVARGEADLAIGSRFVSGRPDGFAAWKALGLTAMARTVGMLTGTRLDDLSCGIRCMNRQVLEAMHPSFDVDYIQETLIQALEVRARLVEVPVSVKYPENGRVGLGGRKLRYIRNFVAITGWSLMNYYRARLFSPTSLRD